MTIQLDGYKISRTQKLEDLTTGLGTSLSAVAEQIWIENPTSSIFRYSELDKARRSEFERSFSGGGLLAGVGFAGGKSAKKTPDSPVISKDEADKRVKDSGVKLEIGANGIPERALDILIERKREEVKRRALIDSAPEGFWNGTAEIGTGLAVSLADPIGVALSFVPVVGQARYAKLMANTSTALGRAGVRTGVGAVEGLAGAALIEPVVLLSAKAEQSDYGLYDSFMNLTFGAVLGGGLHSGLGAVGDAIGRSSPQTKQDMLRAAVGQVMDDRPVDVGFVAKSDPSFRSEWRANQVARAIEGADVDVRVKKEFDIVMDELKPELISKAADLSDGISERAIRDLEAGRVPDVFIDDVARVVKSRIEDFEAQAPKIDAISPEASLEASLRANEFLESAPQETVESVDTLTNDILTALDEQNIDTADLRAEIDDISRSADVEARGLREAIACMLGK